MTQYAQALYDLLSGKDGHDANVAKIMRLLDPYRGRSQDNRRRRAISAARSFQGGRHRD